MSTEQSSGKESTNFTEFTPFNGRLIPRNGRWAGDYFDRLAPDESILEREGATVLDLGASDAGFAHYINSQSAQTGYRATVFRLDLGYHYHPPVSRVLAVAGDACHLPFPDNTFDMLVSVHFATLLTQSELGDVSSETLRVLKPGATAYFNPTNHLDLDRLLPDKNNVMNTNVLGSLAVTKAFNYDDWPVSEQFDVHWAMASRLTHKIDDTFINPMSSEAY